MRIGLLATSERVISTQEALVFGTEEFQRLNAIENPQRRQESLCALSALKEICPFDTLTVVRTESGKPYFQDRNLPFFSLAHTDGLALAVLGDQKSGRVGIDAEPIRPYMQKSRIAERFFDAEEQRLFRESGESDEAFFKIWTTKEAIGKQNGTGVFAAPPPHSERPFCQSYRIRRGDRLYCVTVCSEHSISENLQWNICAKELTYERI